MARLPHYSASLAIAIGLAALNFGSARAADPVELLTIDPANFGPGSHEVTNPWWPAIPGEQKTYEGQSIEDGEFVDHRFVETAVGLTKTVAGISVAVILEEDYRGGSLIEQEIAFHAQDLDGNVWHLGQYREDFEDGVLLGGRVWFEGEPYGAKAGIRMEANPQVGNPELSQGFAPPPFFWTDSGRVSETGLKVTTPAGVFENVIMIDERDQETEDGVFQTKYYAQGVGLVRIGFKGPDPDQEEMVLIENRMLSEGELEERRAIALEIDARGYSYNKTTPAVIIGN